MLRERAGSDSTELELRDGATVDDAIAALGTIAPGLPLRVALNREYVPGNTPISEGDELAAIPPVAGGSSGAGPGVVHVRVTPDAIDVAAITALVGDPGAGAVVTFQGTTREVDRLEYEAYAEMAEPRMAQILADCVERHGLRAAAAEHRIGAVALGEPSVAIAVSAAHRPEAFAGASEAIDRIKAEAPIWKKEVTGGEETWVEGALP